MRFFHIRINQIAKRPRRDSIEWITGRQHNMAAFAIHGDLRFIPTRDGHMTDTIGNRLTVAAGDEYLVVLLDILQKSEMCVAMRSIDGCSRSPAIDVLSR